MKRALDQKLLKQVASANSEACRHVYLSNREAFISLCCTRFRVSNEAARELYHEAILIFFHKAQSGKLATMQSTIRSYLIGITRNLVMRNKSYGQRFLVTDMQMETRELEELFPEGTESEEAKRELEEILLHSLREMPETCRIILNKIYFEDHSLDEVHKLFAYSSKDSLKTVKCRCLKKLKIKVKEKMET